MTDEALLFGGMRRSERGATVRVAGETFPLHQLSTGAVSQQLHQGTMAVVTRNRGALLRPAAYQQYAEDDGDHRGKEPVTSSQFHFLAEGREIPSAVIRMSPSL